MHDTEPPTYMSSLIWEELLFQVAHDDALRIRLGVKPCPFTGIVEEYNVLDRLGGDLNLWPAKFRRVIESDAGGSSC